MGSRKVARKAIRLKGLGCSSPRFPNLQQRKLDIDAVAGALQKSPAPGDLAAFRAALAQLGGDLRQATLLKAANT